MTKLLFATVLLATSLFAQQAQQPAPTPAPDKPAASTADTSTTPAARPGDVDTIEHLIAATYDVISGPAGPRDWDRFKSLFYPDARLIGSARREGKIVARPRSPEQYAQGAGEFFKKEGFFERGLHNDVQQFDHMAQVWSTYESRHKKDGKPFTRGINSFQLLFDGTRWWIVTIYWQDEDPAHPIPARYLPK